MSFGVFIIVLRISKKNTSFDWLIMSLALSLCCRFEKRSDQKMKMKVETQVVAWISLREGVISV